MTALSTVGAAVIGVVILAAVCAGIVWIVKQFKSKSAFACCAVS